MAFPTGWGRQCAITVQSSQIDAALTDWTAVLSSQLPSEMLDTSSGNSALDGGGDIRFSSDESGSQQLACDVRAFHPAAGGVGAYADIAVKLPSVSDSANTTFYIWYKKAGETQPTAADTYGQYNAYDSHYKAVYTLNEDPDTGGAGDIKDRTVNQLHATADAGMTGSNYVDGVIHKGHTFINTTDRVTAPFYAADSAFTLEALLRFNSLTTSSRNLFGWDDGLGAALFIKWQNGNITYTGDGLNQVSLVNFVSANTWHHVAVVRAGDSIANVGLLGYLDGSLSLDHSSSTPDWTTTDPFNIGNRQGANSTFTPGLLDEIRYSTTPRSDAWIKANAVDLNDQSTILTVGSPQDPATTQVATSTLSLTSSASAALATQIVNQSLSLTQTAVNTFSGGKTATSALSLTQTVVPTGLLRHSATSQITLLQGTTVSPYNASADSSFDLTHTARVAGQTAAAVTSALVMSSQASVFSSHQRITQSLSLVSIVDLREKFRQETSDLVLTQVVGLDTSKKIVSPIALTQVATNGQVRTSLSSTLYLWDSARVRNISLSAQNSFTLTQLARSTSIHEQVTTEITITQAENVIKPIYVAALSPLIEDGGVSVDTSTLELTDLYVGLADSVEYQLDQIKALTTLLSFTTSANGYVLHADATPAAAESTLTLTDKAAITPTQEATSTLVLTHSVDAHRVLPIETSRLSTLAQTASVVMIHGPRLVVSEIGLSNALAYYLATSSVTCLYHPFVGSSDDPNAPVPPPSTFMDKSSQSGFELRYPANATPTDTLQLRNPSLGDIHRISMDRVNRETRGGDLKVFADKRWPKSELFLLNFTGLTAVQARALLTFIETHLGEDILLIDWENRLWRGVISEVNDPIVEDRRGSFTGSFEFERVMDISIEPASSLLLNSAAVGVL